ncbi:MAG: hypothetical protein H6562_19900 [Lewinellaceae bacterium]|nr:hypothetical protein [Lewinella sp.]MCB9281161.1 hypothetical protein [Lewinellaceae bacterium]
MIWLQELAQFVHENRLNSIELLDEEGKSKTSEFYCALLNNEIETDDDAAKLLYNSTKNHSSYQRLKSGLKDALLNHLFFLDLKKRKATDLQAAYYDCNRHWAAVKILFGQNAQQIGTPLATLLLKQSRQYEFTEITMDIAKVLRVLYGSVYADRKKYEHYNNMYKEYARINQWEDLAEELYTNLVINYVNNRAVNEVITQRAKEFYKQIERAMGEYDTYRLHLSGYLIKIHAYVNDYSATAKICEAAIRYFEAKPYAAHIPLQVFYYHLIMCFTQLKAYEKGKEAAEKCLSIMEDGSFNWFKYQELYFTLSMHTRQYQQAYTVFSRTVSHKNFNRLPDNVKETWTIFSAYLHYLHAVGLLKVALSEKRFDKPFKKRKLDTDTSIFAKDKRGMNIPILIIEILFLIHRHQYDVASMRTDGIKKYCSRYLTKGDTYRSNCFLKMLLEIPGARYHRVAIQRKTKKYLDRLQKYPLDMAQQSAEIEIIPYEDLWKIAIGTFDNQFHGKFGPGNAAGLRGTLS